MLDKNQCLASNASISFAFAFSRTSIYYVIIMHVPFSKLFLLPQFQAAMRRKHLVLPGLLRTPRLMVWRGLCRSERMPFRLLAESTATKSRDSSRYDTRRSSEKRRRNRRRKRGSQRKKLLCFVYFQLLNAIGEGARS